MRWKLPSNENVLGGNCEENENDLEKNYQNDLGEDCRGNENDLKGNAFCKVGITSGI